MHLFTDLFHNPQEMVDAFINIIRLDIKWLHEETVQIPRPRDIFTWVQSSKLGKVIVPLWIKDGEIYLGTLKCSCFLQSINLEVVGSGDGEFVGRRLDVKGLDGLLSDKLKVTNTQRKFCAWRRDLDGQCIRLWRKLDVVLKFC